MRAAALVTAAAALCIGAIVTARAQQPASPPRAVPTFSQDVAPILYRNCVSCHRPGEMAPMSLLTYAEARPWAKAIAEEVGAGRMPPWHADAAPGTFHGERRLTDDEKAVIARWAANGAPQGDAAALPPPPAFRPGWAIGTPDVVFEVPEAYQVPADGIVNYEYFYLPTNFTEPKWIEAVEVRPGNRKVVHHVLAYYRAAPDQQRTPLLTPSHPQGPPPSPVGTRPPQRLPYGRRLIGSYAPGTNPQIMPPGTALRLEPGGTIELQIHYTSIGEPAADRTRIGFVFARDPKPREVLASAFLNPTLVLPPGASDVRVDADITFLQEATVWGLFPHTHLRGRRWRYELALPDGSRRTVLDIPRYDANWQTYYIFTTPLQVPPGAKLIASAWYDNSAANPANPDPKMEVRWGDQVWEEMHYTGILVSPGRHIP
jgi:hypothetical protein